MAGPSAAALVPLLETGPPLQAFNPAAAMAELSTAARAALAFVTVLALGGLVLWRFEPFVERSIASTRSRPLVSTAYGVAAHVVIVFAGVYLGARLSQFELFGQNTGILGLFLTVALVVGTAAFGFTVVGAAVVEIGWVPNRWTGLVVGAALAAAVAVTPSTAGAVLWMAVVSVGIGGAIRKWLHASAAPEPVEA